MGDLVKNEEKEQVVAKCFFWGVQEQCSTRRRKVPERVSKAVGSAVELVDDAVVVSSQGTDSIVDSGIDDLTRQFASTSAEAVLLRTELFDLEDAHDKVEQEQEAVVRKIRTETKTSEDFFIAKRHGALSC